MPVSGGPASGKSPNIVLPIEDAAEYSHVIDNAWHTVGTIVGAVVVQPGEFYRLILVRFVREMKCTNNQCKSRVLISGTSYCEAAHTGVAYVQYTTVASGLSVLLAPGSYDLDIQQQGTQVGQTAYSQLHDIDILAERFAP